MVIDVHNHFYPKAYLGAIQREKCVARTARDESGNLLIVYEGDFNIVDRGHRDEDFRLQEIERHGIDCQVLTMTTPGVHVEEAGRGVEMARAVNEGFRDIVAKGGRHFEAMAALPLQAPTKAADELVYAVTRLGLKGGTLFTNVSGRNLDAPEFEPIFAVAQDLGVPLFFHPTTPSPADLFLDYRLAATVGFTTDTTLCISRLIFSGLLDRFPNLKIVTSHLGGTLPYLAERLDRGYAVYPECRGAKRAPSNYLKELYYDCVSFDTKTVAYAIDLLGVDQFMAGSDYPHQIGSLDRAVSVINDAVEDPAERDKVSSLNAARVFHIS